MRMTQFITELEDLLREHGDHEVVMQDDDRAPEVTYDRGDAETPPAFVLE